MSADYRVTDRDKGTVLDPFAVKSLVVQTSLEPGGPIALIGYAGLAQLWGKMPTGRWLREVLRGECQSLFDLMEHLHTQLNRKIASFNQVLNINVIMVGDGGNERYFCEFGNTKDFVTAEPQFSYSINPIDCPCMFAIGSADQAALSPPYADMAKAHVKNADRSTADHMELLSKINRGVAGANPDGQVSPYCYVTCVSGDNDWRLASKVFCESGEAPPPFKMPWIMCGIDMSYQAEQLDRDARNRTAPTLDEAQLRRHVQRRP